MMMAVFPDQTPAKSGSPTRSLGAIERRLASAEQELRLQFTRIAQMQAALDLVHAELRRSFGANAPRLGRRHQ